MCGTLSGHCRCGTRTVRVGRHWRDVSWSRCALLISASLAHVSDNCTLCPTCRRDKYSCSALAELGAIRIPCSVPDQNLILTSMTLTLTLSFILSHDFSFVVMQDWSWDAPALDYIDLYFRALK